MVNRPFQMRFIVGVLLIAIAVALVMLAGIYLALWLTLQIFELHREAVTVQLFKNVALFVSLGLMVCAPVLVWGLSRLALVFAHRVAGPLVRIMGALKQMTGGDFNVQVRLRKGDVLDELAAAVNQLADALRRRPR
jgi:signal transduction histidine kinase